MTIPLWELPSSTPLTNVPPPTVFSLELGVAGMAVPTPVFLLLVAVDCGGGVWTPAVGVIVGLDRPVDVDVAVGVSVDISVGAGVAVGIGVGALVGTGDGVGIEVSCGFGVGLGVGAPVGTGDGVCATTVGVGGT